VRVEVEGLIAAADGDAADALAGRGGIDRSIHTSLRPDTSRAMLNDGVGARAPLRPMADGRYEEFSLIGKGGMGAVYLALDTELNRHVAFKMVRPDPDGSGGKSDPPDTPLHATPPTHDEGSRSFDELSVRFLQEAWVTGALEHPGVVPIYELGRTEKGIPFYTMRYVKGERTLAEALKEVEDIDDRLALLEPFLKICDTIRYAHSRDIIHRDLKPENIALGSFGEVIVLDWGLSKMQEQPDVAGSMWRARIEEYREAGDLKTVAGVMGTPGYMAPEAALGKNDEIDARSDVYSLGAMLYQILTGRLPFEFKTYMQYVEQVLEGAPPLPHEVDAAVPEELSAVCAKALAKSREERYESVDALARDVRRWQSEGRVAREVADLVRSAESEIEAARGARGNMALWHLDRASTACTRALHLHGGHEQATALVGEIKRHREQAIRERVSVNRRRVLVATGFLVLAVAAVVTMWLAKARADQREAAQRELAAVRESAAESERRAERAYDAARQARRQLADGYADLARVHLRDGWTAAARLVAIQGLRRAGTPSAWRALAEAEARWTPTLHAVVPLQGTSALAFAPDGRRLFAGTKAGAVYAIDPSTKEANELGRDTAEISVLAVSPDGKLVAAAGHSGRVGVW
jgi:serine/threonine protein kinase